MLFSAFTQSAGPGGGGRGGTPACGARLILSVRWPLTLLSLPPPLLLFIRYIIRLLFYYTTL
jgi:hypothetical protein